jgi:acetyl-CoA carboxylase carboxyltransferase component
MMMLGALSKAASVGAKAVRDGCPNEKRSERKPGKTPPAFQSGTLNAARSNAAFSGELAAGRRLVDAVIEPSQTRRHVAQVLEYLHTKRELRPPKKHGLMPL